MALLTWFLLYRLHQRLERDRPAGEQVAAYPRPVVYGFAGSLGFGVLLSLFFTLQHTDLAGYLVLSLLPLALLLPIYRAECLLGFVLGMTFTFGGVLPIGIGSLFLAIGAVLYLLVRPGIRYVALRVARVATPSRQSL